MCSYILFCARLFFVIQLAYAQCTGNNRTTFLRSEGLELDGSDEISLTGTSLNECSQYCKQNTDSRGNPFTCNTFQYTASTQRCLLSRNSAQPFGDGVLRNSTSGSSTSFYQKVCMQSPLLCDAPFSFERLPQHVLVGFSLEVMKVPSLSDCLTSCLEASQLLNLECKSAMYFYDTTECILNREDRRTQSSLFSADTQGFIVDYFDNNCAGAQCFPPEIPQFVRSKNYELRDQKDVTLTSVDFDSCQHFCSSNQNGHGEQFSCKSFMYSEQSRTCYLADEKSLPIGRAELAEAFDIDYYEKACFSAPQTCGGRAAFERYPGHVLVGFAAEVTKSPTLNDCLNQCLAANERSVLNCRSAMYYYDTTECLLNKETRLTQSGLFAKDLTGARVDYFDNNCFENPDLCAEGQSKIYVKVSNARLTDFEANAQSGLTLQQCLQECSNARTFTCRSANFANGVCRLSYQNSLLVELNQNPDQPSEYYEARCVDRKDTSECSNRVYAFDYRPNQALVGSVATSVSGISRDACLSMCLSVGSAGSPRCLSVNYVQLSSTCQLNSAAASSQEQNKLVSTAGTQYYENQCVATETNCTYQEVARDSRHRSAFRMAERSAATVADCQRACDRETTFVCRSFSFGPASYGKTCYLSDTDSRKSPTSQLLEAAQGFVYYEKSDCSGSAAISVECDYNGARVRVMFPTSTTGVLFARNFFDTCRAEFKNVTVATLDMPFPGSAGAKACGGTQIGRNTYSFMVVLQQNNLGVYGLMMRGDQMYNVSCDYTEQPTVTVATAATISGPTALTNLYPPGRVLLDANVEMLLMRDGEPVNSVVLGEQLELMWRKKQSAGMGFFIRRCQAERVGGNPPFPEPLELIHEGCPENKIKRKIIGGPIERIDGGYQAPFVVFRFDGSKSVKLTCHVDMCADQCNPTTCIVDNVNVLSFGRHKRRSLEVSFPGLERQLAVTSTTATLGTVLDQGTISGVFTVIEKSAINTTTRLHPEPRGPINEGSVLLLAGKICLVRSLFIGVFTFLSLLCGAEGTVVAIYFYRRVRDNPDDRRSFTSGSRLKSSQSATTTTFSCESEAEQTGSTLKTYLQRVVGTFSTFKSQMWGTSVTSIGSIDENSAGRRLGIGRDILSYPSGSSLSEEHHSSDEYGSSEGVLSTYNRNSRSRLSMGTTSISSRPAEPPATLMSRRTIVPNSSFHHGERGPLSGSSVASREDTFHCSELNLSLHTTSANAATKEQYGVISKARKNESESGSTTSNPSTLDGPSVIAQKPAYELALDCAVPDDTPLGVQVQLSDEAFAVGGPSYSSRKSVRFEPTEAAIHSSSSGGLRFAFDDASYTVRRGHAIVRHFVPRETSSGPVRLPEPVLPCAPSKRFTPADL